MAGPPTFPNEHHDRQQNPANDTKKPSPAGPQSPEEEPKRSGWLEKIAQQSTGLPPDRPPESPGKDGQSDASLWTFAGLGLQFALTTAFFVVMGVYLDHEFGWTPWGVVACTMIGLIGGFYLLIKEAMRMNK